MPKTLKVLGQYVVLKVKDVGGSDVMMGYYQHAVVPNVDDVSANHNIGLGFAEEYAEPAAEPAVPDPPTDPGSDAPKGNASREEWAAYAASKGAPEDDTRPVEDGGLKQTELREKYGS